MKDVLKQVAYLQGLADGMELEDTKEGRVISEMLNLLEDMADYIGFLREQQEDMEDYMESIDSDLSDLEDEVYGDEDCCCCEEEDDDEEDPVFYAVTCEACGNEITVDEDVLDLGSIDCPHCGELIILTADNVEELVEEDED